MKAGTISGSVGMATKIAVTNISKNQKQRRGGEPPRNIRPPHVLQRAKGTEIIGLEKPAEGPSDKTTLVSFEQ